MTEDEVKAVRDILKYIEKHPRAKHTANGIARHWIFQQRLEERLEIVLPAIDFLVKSGFLELVTRENGSTYYTVNRTKIPEIATTIARLEKMR